MSMTHLGVAIYPNFTPPRIWCLFLQPCLMELIRVRRIIPRIPMKVSCLIVFCVIEIKSFVRHELPHFHISSKLALAFVQWSWICTGLFGRTWRPMFVTALAQILQDVLEEVFQSWSGSTNYSHVSFDRKPDPGLVRPPSHVVSWVIDLGDIDQSKQASDADTTISRRK